MAANSSQRSFERGTEQGDMGGYTTRLAEPGDHHDRVVTPQFGRPRPGKANRTRGRLGLTPSEKLAEALQ